MKKSYIALYLVCIFILPSLYIAESNNVIDYFTLNEFQGSDDFVNYLVTDSSETNNSFFGDWPPGDFFGYWDVSSGEKIDFLITSSNSTTIYGNLTIGNYSFFEVRNVDIASALVISVYPWKGGFVLNEPDWDDINILVAGTNTTIESKTDVMYSVNNRTKTFDVNEITTVNYYGQNSTFIYDTSSNILLECFTSFGNYNLGLILDQTSFISSESDENNKTDVVSLFAFGFPLLFLCIVSIISFRKYNKY